MADRLRIRGGDSFLLSPRYCGSRATGWYPTKQVVAGGLSLATAMAISGAAVNPDAANAGVGPQRNTTFALLMALLNIRLGYWIPNPLVYNERRQADPNAKVPVPNHFNPGFFGVIDRLTRQNELLELTDGGNFDNLGVYELLKRQVQTIVVCDATADPKSGFADLQTLLSRAEADFSVSITFEPPPLEALLPTGQVDRYPLGVAFAAQPYAIGTIRYKDFSEGLLVYIKPAIFDALRLHVLGFKGANHDFPNDSTLNQFFDEARFEAYRELGFSCVERMMTRTDLATRLKSM